MASNIGSVTGKFDFGFFVNLECSGKKNVLDWSKRMNLISDHYECPECESPMLLEQRESDIDGYVWICRQEGQNEHLVERSVRQGSIFQQQPNLSIVKILLLTYLWIKKASREFIEDELGIPLEIIDEWLDFCREFCLEICMCKNTVLGGKNVMVEINECRYQKKKFVKNENVSGSWIYVGFEKETDKNFVEVVKEQSITALAEFIDKNILPGTVLVSDLWKLYDCLGTVEFKKLKKEKSMKFEDLGVGEFGSSVIGLRRSVKRSISDDPRVSVNLDVYLAEYMWRRSNSEIPYEMTRSFIENVGVIFPPDTKDCSVLQSLTSGGFE